MKPNFSQDLSVAAKKLKPSGIREFFDIVAERTDCISLGIGEPDFVSPQVVIDESIKALRDGYTHYTSNLGMPNLRKAIANYLQKEYNLEYNPDNEILITVGVSQGIDLALRALLNPEERVAYLEPSYVSYNPMISLAGGTPVVIKSGVESDFILKPELIPNNLKALLLNYPSNPTGVAFKKSLLEDIAKKSIDQNIYVISDEIYAELSYDSKHVPIASLPGMKERTLTLGGFSKSFAMTGWRIGYAAGPSEWISTMTKIHQYSMLSAPTIGQIAATVALERAIPDRDKMYESFRKRRDYVYKALKDLTLEVTEPTGAFYIFPKLPDLGISSVDFSKKLLDKQNVAVVPGSAFGDSGEGYFRISYATSLDELKIAIERIGKFINSLKAKDA